MNLPVKGKGFFRAVSLRPKSSLMRSKSLRRIIPEKRFMGISRKSMQRIFPNLIFCWQDFLVKPSRRQGNVWDLRIRAGRCSLTSHGFSRRNSRMDLCWKTWKGLSSMIEPTDAMRSAGRFPRYCTLCAILATKYHGRFWMPRISAFLKNAGESILSERKVRCRTWRVLHTEGELCARCSNMD